MNKKSIRKIETTLKKDSENKEIGQRKAYLNKVVKLFYTTTHAAIDAEHRLLSLTSILNDNLEQVVLDQQNEIKELKHEVNCYQKTLAQIRHSAQIKELELEIEYYKNKLVFLMESISVTNRASKDIGLIIKDEYQGEYGKDKSLKEIAQIMHEEHNKEILRLKTESEIQQ